jgi:hypothetical protein
MNPATIGMAAKVAIKVATNEIVRLAKVSGSSIYLQLLMM